MSKTNIKHFIEENLDSTSDEPFFIFDVQDIIHKHQKWLQLMPRVVPYYAVKANRFPLLLEIMIGLGLKFDCASQYELEEILSRGGNPDDIIIAHPSKTNTFLEYSKANGTDLMTFDNEEELAKINSIFPSARLLLRIKVDDRNSSVRLGLKFGADMKNVENLLRKAKDMNMNVMGIAFHVGSVCQSSQSYFEAIETSRIAFNMAIDMGFQMSLLDIGGGFPGSQNIYYTKLGDSESNFEEMASQINKGLSYFYPEQSLNIIGEPGRYYCESAFALVTKIISKAVIRLNDEKTVMYYLNDGIYSSFLDGILDNRIYEPTPLLKNKSELCLRNVYSSILWGPTCDSSDCVRSNFKMPEMNIGEWLLFEDMGSYSQPYSQFGFNGMPSPTVKIYVSKYAETNLMKTKIWPKIKSYLADDKWKNIYQEKVWFQLG